MPPSMRPRHLGLGGGGAVRAARPLGAALLAVLLLALAGGVAGLRPRPAGLRALAPAGAKAAPWRPPRRTALSCSTNAVEQQVPGGNEEDESALEGAEEDSGAEAPRRPAPSIIRSVVGAFANLIHNGEGSDEDDEDFFDNDGVFLHPDDGFEDDRDVADGYGPRGPAGAADAPAPAAEAPSAAQAAQAQALMPQVEGSRIADVIAAAAAQSAAAAAVQASEAAQSMQRLEDPSGALHEEEHEGNHVSVLGSPTFFSPNLDGDYRVSRTMPFVNGHLHWECLERGMHLYWKAPKWRIGPDLYSINNVAQLKVISDFDAKEPLVDAESSALEAPPADSAVEGIEWSTLLFPQASPGAPQWNLKVDSSWKRCSTLGVVPLGEADTYAADLLSSGGGQDLWGAVTVDEDGAARAASPADRLHPIFANPPAPLPLDAAPSLATAIVATAAALGGARSAVAIAPGGDAASRAAAGVAAGASGEGAPEIVGVAAPIVPADTFGGGGHGLAGSRASLLRTDGGLTVLTARAGEDGRLPAACAEAAAAAGGLDLLFLELLSAEDRKRTPGERPRDGAGVSVLGAAAQQALALLRDGGALCVALRRRGEPPEKMAADAGDAAEEAAFADFGTPMPPRDGGEGPPEGPNALVDALGAAPPGLEGLWELLAAQAAAGQLELQRLVPVAGSEGAAVVIVEKKG